MNAKRCAIGAALFVVLAPCPAAPQQAAGDTSRVIPLDRLRVTVARGTTPVARLPAAVASVTASDVRDGQLTVGLDESLARVPGVFVNNRYNFSLGARISIRGLGSRAAFGVRGIRVLSDGIPMTMPDGQTNLNNLDLGAAGRIDVLRGPASALYGNAAGGVISIETETPPATLAGEIRTLAGTAGRAGDGLDNFFKVQGRVGGGLASGGFLASVSRMTTDGYRDFSKAEQNLVNVVARHPLGDNSLISVILNAVDAPVAQSPGALPIDSVRVRPTMAWPNNARTFSGEATSQVQAGVAIAHALGNNRIDIAAYGLGRDVDNALPFGFIDLSRRGGGLRATYAGAPLPRLSLTGGVDLEWQSDGRKEYNNDGGRAGTELRRDQRDQVSTLAPFAQALVSVAPRLDLLLGARYDGVRFSTSDEFMADGRDDSGDRTLSAFSPMAGLSFALNDQLRVYGNVATAFQTPTTTELINSPPVDGQPCCPGGFNTDLDAQRAVSFEAGLRGAVGRVAVDASLYHMDVDKTIVPFQVADGQGREFFRNAGASRHRGFELALSAPFGAHSATLGYTFNDFVFTDDGDTTVDNNGNQLPGVPRQHVFLGARFQPVRAVRVDIDLDRTGEYFANDANDANAVNPAATVIDLRFLFDTRVRGVAARPFIGIGNLTDRKYNSSVVVNAVGRRYYEPAPRRNFYLGLTLASGAWPAR
jgi:iron complex outermembrane receptor protein